LRGEGEKSLLGCGSPPSSQNGAKPHQGQSGLGIQGCAHATAPEHANARVNDSDVMRRSHWHGNRCLHRLVPSLLSLSSHKRPHRSDSSALARAGRRAGCSSRKRSHKRSHHVRNAAPPPERFDVALTSEDTSGEGTRSAPLSDAVQWAALWLYE
jgi:hypothetical protein